ncbi:MAG: hypothetical protein KF842_04110 [Caulobacter sp.]|nr:hypothetical protein [Caulobacter sp.]
MRRLPMLIALLGMAAASPAAAQFLGPQEGVTPEVVAKARAEADSLIEAGGVSDLFENVTVGIDPRIRHLRSGLVCSFTPGSEVNKVMVFEGGLPRGDDVGCNTSFGDMTVTHYATRYDRPYTPEVLAEDAGRAIEDRWDTAVPYQGAVATAEEDDLPPTSAVRYLIGPAEKQGYTQALTARIGEWSFKQRMTMPADGAVAAMIMSGMTWNSVLRQAVSNPGHD